MRATTHEDAIVQLAVVSAAWERATPSQRERLRVAASDEAGLVQRRKVRRLGVTVSIYNREQGIDCDPDANYVLVCDDHGGMLAVRTLSLARNHAPVPDDWCPYCRGEETP